MIDATSTTARAEGRLRRDLAPRLDIPKRKSRKWPTPAPEVWDVRTASYCLGFPALDGGYGQGIGEEHMRGLRGSKLTRVPLKLAGRGQRLNAAQTCGLIWSKLKRTSAVGSDSGLAQMSRRRPGAESTCMCAFKALESSSRTRHLEEHGTSKFGMLLMILARLAMPTYPDEYHSRRVTVGATQLFPPTDTLVGTLGVVTPMRLSTESHRTKDRQNLLHKLFPVPGPECFGRRTLGFLI
ncbi:hypothetical protein X797_005510 [Metarhizium robertsii]|uniref:Uncharacterized protein n=2 Tax=Metarhizium robertsii TaxID=568076 RepID=A0A014PBP0_9HYPO|nr:hypothetical protein X797_005510 [Metarhizium robertsii]